MAKKSNLVSFAENELARLGNCEYQAEMNKHILGMIKVFDKEGHSGFSAGYATSILNRLLRFLPLSAIEDNPEDWNEVAEGIYQHKRCSFIFKDKALFNGQAYTLYGKVFSDDKGKTWFTNDKSKEPIEFPYVVTDQSKKFLVERDENDNIIIYGNYGMGAMDGTKKHKANPKGG